MAHIVILGAGIGGLPMAYDMKRLARPQDKITVVSNVDYFHFVPSNPWVAVNWRKRDDIQFPIAPYLAKKGIDFVPVGAKRLHPDQNRLELVDGRSISTTTIWSSRPGPSSLSTRSKVSDRPAIRNRSATSIMRKARRARGPSSSRIRVRSSWARCRAPRATGPRTSSQ